MYTSLEKLKNEARQKILNLSLFYGKNEEYISESEVLKKNNDDNVNRNINGSKNTKNAKEEREILQSISILINNEYLHQPLLDGNWFDLFREEIDSIRTSSVYVEHVYSTVKSAIDLSRKKYLKRREEFEERKKSMLLEKQAVEEQLRSAREEMNAETTNTKLCLNELKECERIYESVRNEIPLLMARIMVPEACYMIMTWLSPAEWKSKMNVEKFNDDFAKFDSYLTEGHSDGYTSYIDYVHLKSLEEFSNDVRKKPVLETYWKSVDHFSKRLTTLDKQTIDKILLPDVIAKSLKASTVGLNDENKTKRSKRVFIETIKHGLLQSMKDQAAKIKSASEEANLLDTNLAIDDRLMLDIYTELNHPIGDFTQHYNVIELLFVKLYEALDESDDIPADQWRKTEEILQAAERDSETKHEIMKYQRNLIKNVRHEADKMYELPATDIRKQKIIPYRRLRPKRKQLKESKKPKLNEKQLMYLKYFTHLLPHDIDDDAISSVPEVNLEEL